MDVGGKIGGHLEETSTIFDFHVANRLYLKNGPNENIHAKLHAFITILKILLK